MRVLVILVLLSILGVSSIYGEEKSCDELILAISSKLTKDFDALKVYKKVEDMTEMYIKGKKENSNDVAPLKRSLMLAEIMLLDVPRELRSFQDLETRLRLEMMKLLVKDIEDRSSEVVLFCVGRMRSSDGVRHFMLSITKDEEGDRYWRAWLL